MERKDFERLLGPYTENGRTIGGQIDWLIKNHQMPQHCIDVAMVNVYKELSQGKTFLNGGELDQYILHCAKKIHQDELAESMLKRIGDLSNSLDLEWNQLTKWQKIVQVLKGLA